MLLCIFRALPATRQHSSPMTPDVIERSKFEDTIFLRLCVWRAKCGGKGKSSDLAQMCLKNTP